MLAFTNTTFTKDQAVALAQVHQDQDDFIRGTYGEQTPTDWKGCSVGCMAKGKHEDYSTLFGIDPKIAYLSDKFFENITDYKTWTVKLFTSVKEGSDTTIAYYKFMHWLLLDEDHGVVKHSSHTSISEIGGLFLAASRGEVVTRQQWMDASNAAYAAYTAANAAYAVYAAYAASNAANAAYTAANAANAAYTAAYTAANASNADYAAYTASNAAYTASNAAYTAAYAAYTASNAANAASNAANAAYTAARLNHYDIMADKLCYFLAGN